mgnify:CR=1 FL=1
MKFQVSLKQIAPCGGNPDGGWAVMLRDVLTGDAVMESPTMTLEKAASLRDALESSFSSTSVGPLGREAERNRDTMLRETLQKALASYDALTPEQKLAHRREQAISWVYGEANMRAPEGKELLSRDEVARIVDLKIEDGSFTLRP